MKKLLVLVVCFLLSMNVLALDGTPALDEQSDVDIIISPQDPAISSIIEKMDEAKSNGDIVLFRQLLSEYKELNPAITVEEGPEVTSDVSEVQPLWIDDDIQIDSAYNYQGFSMDTRNESRVYLTASRQLISGENYKIPIWYSDDGITWNYRNTLSWVGHDLINPSLKIVETPDTHYLFVAFEAYTTSGSYDRDILVYRANLDGAGSDFFYPAQDDSIDEKNPSLDADDLAYPTSPYLHLAFESADSIAYMRSSDLGATWTNRAIIAVGTVSYDYYDPSLAYGPASPGADSMNLGVAWAYQTTSGVQNIRFRRNRYKGQPADWLGIEYFTSPANCFDDRPSLKMTHGTMNSATITFARRDTAGTDNEDLCNFFTYDAGRTWDEDALYTNITGEMLSSLAADDSPGDFHVFFKGLNDDIRYKEAPYDNFSYPGGWTSSILISDTSSAGGNVSDVTPPASAVRGEDPCVCWKTYINGGWKLRFDALWLTSGIEEPEDNAISLLGASPAVFAHKTNISYSLPTGQNITLEIYDALGRNVKTLASGAKAAGNHSVTWNGESDNGEPLASGIYLCVLKAGNSKSSEKITLIK